MLRLYNSRKSFELPSGFALEREKTPSPIAVNRLLSQCRLETHPPKKLALALNRSDFYLSIFDLANGDLCGFIRVTSDKGLNANLWDLAALPGDNQPIFVSILVCRALEIIKREMPGCSVSISASKLSVEILKNQGFLVDPNGIRVMGFRLR